LHKLRKFSMTPVENLPWFWADVPQLKGNEGSCSLLDSAQSPSKYPHDRD